MALIYKTSVSINAPKEIVWDALTNPEMTKLYMFGCEVETDWKVGSPVNWNGELGGKRVTFVVGNVVEIDPGNYLAYTVFDPNAGMEDIPENYLTSTYTLTEENGATRLDVTQGDYEKVANGESRYKDTEGGWQMTLKRLKEVLEG